MKKIISVLLACIMMLSLLSACAGGKDMGFYHVENGKIVDGDGNEALFMGIALGNDIWNAPTEPVLTNHDESSYEEIAAMGFNCVRYYLNYHIFEDDSKPYEYKEEGFDWIDKNIKWAKKNGVGIVLNMHWPQGGYQSQGKGTELWLSEECQNRLISLWAEFAKRYADEPTIIGYGLINEPIVTDIGTVKESADQCRDLMQRITDEIRKYDTNHIIIAERPLAVQDINTLQTDFNIPLEDTQFLLDDSNVAYEFHCYDPYSFTHQNMDWANTAGQTATYPSDTVVAVNVIDDWVNCSSTKKTAELEDGWAEFRSSAVTKTDEYNIGSIALRAPKTGDETAYFDDIKVEVYKDGELVKTIHEYGFDYSGDSGEFYFWSASGKGSYSRLSSGGYNNSGCYAITGTDTDANITGCKFALEEGYEYILSAKVKAPASVKAEARIDFSLAESTYSWGYDYLESVMVEYAQFGIDNNVPMFMGEFGAAASAFELGRGGEKWVADMIDICKKYDISFIYHSYHEPSFGLYMSSADTLPDPEHRNEALYEAFVNGLK